jgi:hypothetical protein
LLERSQVRGSLLGRMRSPHRLTKTFFCPGSSRLVEFETRLKFAASFSDLNFILDASG